MRNIAILPILCTYIQCAHAADSLNPCPADNVYLTTTAAPPSTIAKLRQHRTGIGKISKPNTLAILGDSLVEQWPKQQLDKEAAGTTVNLGVGGDKTQNLIWRLEDLTDKQISAETVVILIGTNNVSAGDRGCAIYAGITKIASLAKRKLTPKRVYVIAIPPRFDAITEKQSRERIEANSLINASTNWTTIDLDNLLSCFDGCNLFASDRLHLSPAGYAVAGAVLTHRLQP